MEMPVAPGNPDPLPADTSAVGDCAAAPAGTVSSAMASRHVSQALVFMLQAPPAGRASCSDPRCCRITVASWALTCQENVHDLLHIHHVHQAVGIDIGAGGQSCVDLSSQEDVHAQ